MKFDRIGHWVPHVHLTLNAGGEGKDWCEGQEVAVQFQPRLATKALNTKVDATVSVLPYDKWDPLSVVNL